MTFELILSLFNFIIYFDLQFYHMNQHVKLLKRNPTPKVLIDVRVLVQLLSSVKYSKYLSSISIIAIWQRTLILSNSILRTLYVRVGNLYQYSQRKQMGWMGRKSQRRWKVEGTKLRHNWKSLLLRVRQAQVNTTPVTTADATTATIRDKDGCPTTMEPCVSAGGWVVRKNEKRSKKVGKIYSKSNINKDFYAVKLIALIPYN